MNGRDKVERQIRVGTRRIVESVDNLRLSFGFENVKSLTPIVETKLRNGNIPQRPLQMIFQPIQGHDFSFIITIPIRFPEEPYHVGPQISIPIPIEKAAEFSIFEELINNSILSNLESVESGVKAAKDILLQPSHAWLLNLTHSNAAPTTVVADDDEDEDDNGFEDDHENNNDSFQTHSADDNHADANESLGTNDCSHYYCCRICSTKLFDTNQIVHSSKKKVKCSTIYLLEAPEFLVTKSDEQEGKIYCPKCAGRVGSWSWVGTRCSCKEWISPSFQFAVSKVDEKVYK